MSPIHIPTVFGALRSWRDDDAADLAVAADDRRVWRNLRDAFPHPYGLEDGRRFIAMARARSPDSYLAIEVDGHAAGGIGYTLHGDVERIAAEVGYWLGAQHWGRGIMTTAVRRLSQHAFASQADLRRLYAVPFAWNPASARVLQKAGYRLEATLRQSACKDGEIVDQWLYALLREELDDGPVEPRARASAEIALRPVEARDTADVIAIAREVVQDGTTYALAASASDDDLRALFLPTSGDGFVAEVAGRVAGCYVLKPNQPGRGSHVANAAYAVAGHARGRGIGEAMGRHSIATAQRIGFRALQFNLVVSTNATAVRLWQRLGFTIVGWLPKVFDHPRDGLVDAYVMHRFL